MTRSFDERWCSTIVDVVRHIRASALGAVRRMSPIAAVICVALLVAPLLPPSPSILYNWHDGVLVAPFRIWRYISIAVILMIFILVGKIKDPFVGGVLLLAVLVFFSTWMCDGSKRDCVYDWSGYVAAVLLVAMLCRIRMKELLQGVLATVVLMSLLNIVSVLLFPDGVYDLNVYFYGNRNIAYQLSFLAIACANCARYWEWWEGEGAHIRLCCDCAFPDSSCAVGHIVHCCAAPVRCSCCYALAQGAWGVERDHDASRFGAALCACCGLQDFGSLCSVCDGRSWKELVSLRANIYLGFDVQLI